MKNISKKLIIIFLFFAAANILSQEQHYIQIIVSDTVILKPLQFTYKISESSYTYNPIDTQIAEKVSLSEVNEKLEKENFTERVKFNDFSISGYSKTDGEILVTINSLAELQRLYILLKDINGIMGKISNIQYESPEVYTDRLFGKMFQKAKKQAEMMAGATGNQLGGVTNVSEVKGQWDSIFDMYAQFEREMPTEFLRSNPDFGKTYYRNFQFTFELK